MRNMNCIQLKNKLGSDDKIYTFIPCTGVFFTKYTRKNIILSSFSYASSIFNGIQLTILFTVM